jgi:hypothetical protein
MFPALLSDLGLLRAGLAFGPLWPPEIEARYRGLHERMVATLVQAVPVGLPEHLRRRAAEMALQFFRGGSRALRER